ncbi:MAG: CHAT domain-containing protein [Rhodocyclaceae bacterium]|nr:CHAT domain-containing protein [Rhodocyclaceae bacterium]
MRILRPLIARLVTGLLLVATIACAAPAADVMAPGVALRNSGNLQQAIEYFTSLQSTAQEGAEVAIGGELGATLLQARRYDLAEPLLRAAYDKSVGRERARYAIELGNLAAARQRPQEALRLYREAQALDGDDPALALVARIDEARLVPRPQRPALVAALSRDLAAVKAPLARARMRLSVGTLASQIGSVQTAYENFEEGRALAVSAGDARIEVEALDGLAQIYEEQGRRADALSLSRRGIARANAAEGTDTDILLKLEWRQGRLLAAAGANDEAMAAYQRTVDDIESIRQDIPIEYEDGRSSFHDTLEPIYLGYIDLLLKKADAADVGARAAVLRQTRDVAELIKQSELQDYLGERCSVDAAQNGGQAGVAPGTAIFYPIVLKDRVEVIFESHAGIVHHTTALDAKSLRQLVSSYTSLLREGEEGYRGGATRLYDILIRPFERDMADQGLHTLLVVPDGVLRVLPWATLYDGKQYLVEKYSIVINSGLSMTNQSAGRAEGFTALVAGMAEPGPIVDKLSSGSLDHIVGPATTTRSGFSLKLAHGDGLRSVSIPARMRSMDRTERAASLKAALALPGVKTEVDALSKILPGTRLLDSTFTTDRLHDEFDRGEYRIAHLATHGFFGSTGDQSYLMAYNDIVTMDGLQKLLQLEGVKKNPLELLTLSACETAEGDDRSPLGIAGAAIKAKAKSVLGTLWPVSDTAAQKVMVKFYGSLMGDGVSKAEALRRAQVALIHDPELDHPFYWAPFILVGNWR